MRELSSAELDAVLEALGYYRQSDGSLLTSGKSTGPKGMWVGPLEEGEYITVNELRTFLVYQLELLEDEVDDAFWEALRIVPR